MSDLRGQQLKDSYKDVVTRGAGNKLENGNGVEFADLDDKASLSDTVGAITADDGNLNFHEAQNTTITASSYSTIFDLSGSHELLSGVIMSAGVGYRLTIDGQVVINRGSNSLVRGRNASGNIFSITDLPRSKSTTSLKLEVYNRSGSDQEFGWRIITRSI